MLFENIRETTICIALLNEGTDVWHRVRALQVGPHTFVVLLTQAYDPETEEWEFPPGSVVVCQEQTKSGEVPPSVQATSSPRNAANARHNEHVRCAGLTRLTPGALEAFESGLRAGARALVALRAPAGGCTAGPAFSPRAPAMR
jgi:hypothetical protein